MLKQVGVVSFPVSQKRKDLKQYRSDWDEIEIGKFLDCFEKTDHIGWCEEIQLVHVGNQLKRVQSVEQLCNRIAKNEVPDEDYHDGPL